VTIRDAKQPTSSCCAAAATSSSSELGRPAFFDEPWERLRGRRRGHVAHGVALIAEEDEPSSAYRARERRAADAGRGHLTTCTLQPMRAAAASAGTDRRVIEPARVSAVSRTSPRRRADDDNARAGCTSASASRAYDVLMARRRWRSSQQQLAAPAAARRLRRLHVQTDDVEACERASQQFHAARRTQRVVEVSQAEHGWVAVVDELCDRDRGAQRRLGAELSERMGVPVVALALEEEASSATCSSSAAGWSTSTSPSRRTTAT
jgi:hypothetical protein